MAAIAKGQMPASLAAKGGDSGQAVAILLLDDEADAFPAPVSDSNWACLVIVCQAILGQLAYGVLGLMKLFLQLLIPIHNLAAWFLQELPEVVHSRGSGKEGGKLINKPIP